MKKIVVSFEILVLFLIIGSTIALAVANDKASDHVLAPQSSEFLKPHQNTISTQSGSLQEVHGGGFAHGPVARRHISHVSTPTASAPTTYDLRPNKVTPVKDQGKSGSCWAFATYGSLESYLLGIDGTYDFSENNLKNVLSNVAPEGFDFTEGGNEFMSTAYLARWSGPVSETDDQYILPYPASFLDSELGLPVKKHVQNVLFIPDRTGSLDNANIKSAIQQYGAVYTSMYYDNAYYSSIKSSYHYNGRNSANHAVAIVGWDDNYNKKNFPKVPRGNGAFIVKNSWGTNWGNQGYFYVSYYDLDIGKNNAVFTAVLTNDVTNNYKDIYQYDPLGWTTSLGYGNPAAWCANIFTAYTDENLNAVSLYTTDSNCGYVISVYKDIGSNPTNPADPVLTQTGTIQFAGYHTIPLTPGVPISANQKFSVVLKLTTPNYIYPIAIEKPISGYSSKATANAGESFISPDGKTWTDITTAYPKTNVCIKAFS